MKLVRSEGDHLIYQLNRHDQALLLAVLERYPLIPPAHQPLSRESPASQPLGSQQLLDQALEDQRAENRNRLQTFLNDPKRFRENERGCVLALSKTDREWLLQILNDVRVGSWLRLGSPEDDFDTMDLGAESAADAMTMHMAGLFQMRLLEPAC